MASCGQNSAKLKELELKEREIALLEKKLALDSVQNAKASSITQKDQQLPIPKVPLTRASNVSINCNGLVAPQGDHPLIIILPENHTTG